MLPSGWSEAIGNPPLSVFDAVVVARDGRIALVGGVDTSFQTTQAIQIFHPDRGWLPIGQQMREPRAGHTLTPLGDGRVLVVGGLSGTVGADARPLRSTEILDPFVAGSDFGPPLEEPLLGHTAHAVGPGRVAVVGGSVVRVFDAAVGDWIDRRPLLAARRHHASVFLPDFNAVLVVGGDDRGSVETVSLDGLVALPAEEGAAPGPAGRPWPENLPRALERSAAVLLPDGRVFLVGGVDRAVGRSVAATWFLEPQSQRITPGPELPLPRGLANPRLLLDGGRVLILGGEWIAPDARGEADAAFLYDPNQDRLFGVAPIPESASRRAWYRDERGRVACLGGYRFLTPEAAQAEGIAPGPRVLGSGHTLHVGGFQPLLD